MQENELSGTMPDVFDGLPRVQYWDTYANQITGDLPPSIQNISATLEHLYIQTEQTDALRNFRCRERIPGLGNLRALRCTYMHACVCAHTCGYPSRIRYR